MRCGRFQKPSSATIVFSAKFRIFYIRVDSRNLPLSVSQSPTVTMVDEDRRRGKETASILRVLRIYRRTNTPPRLQGHSQCKRKN
jgi:hypothetical protein